MLSFFEALVHIIMVPSHCLNCCPQPPLLSLALGACDGTFLPVNVGLLIAGLPLYVLPFHLDWFLRQPAPSPENAALEQRLLNRGRPAPDQFDTTAVEIPEVYSV